MSALLYIAPVAAIAVTLWVGTLAWKFYFAEIVQKQSTTTPPSTEDGDPR